jgi:hypothetical protein
VKACPVIIRYRVQFVVWENLAGDHLVREVGCGLLSSGLVSAVW